MTEEIIIDDVKVNECRHFKYDGIKKPICRSGGCVAVYHSCLCEDNKDCDYKQLKLLERENKDLYEEKNCLHKIIDRLLENAGYSKDIASAEDFEDVYEDMQIKRNELIELEQENKELKKQHYETLKMLKHEYDGRQRDNEQWFTRCTENHNEDSKIIEKYRSALEEIRGIINKFNADVTFYHEIPEKEIPYLKEQFKKIDEYLSK